MNTNEFNVFKFLCIDKKENISSQFIASILSADKNYLKSFLKVLECEDYFDENEIDNGEIQIRTEKKLKSIDGIKDFGRTDIWIGNKVSKGRKRIIIENKIDASDQVKQLWNYRLYLKERGTGKLYYLNPIGKPAVANSSSSKEGLDMDSNNADEGYKIINYGEHILKWLDVVKKENNISQKLSNIIEQYIEAIEPLTLLHKRVVIEKKNINDVDEKYKQEFKSLLELNFWLSLSKLFFGANKSEIDRRRRFSYQKIDKKQKNNAKSYGLIVGNFRIQNDYFNKKLIFSKGYFNEKNNWVKDKDRIKIIEYYPFDSFDNIFSAEESAKKIFLEFQNFINNSQS